MLTITVIMLCITLPAKLLAQCAACVIDTTLCPITGDAVVCADSLSNGSAGLNYEDNVTFSMALRYVVKQGDTIPGIGVSVDFLQNFGFPITVPIIIPVINVTLSSISGLPPGISWECDSSANGCVYMPTHNSHYGCVKFCGIPDCDSAGIYDVVFEYSYLLDMQQVINSFTGGPIPFPFPIPTEVPVSEMFNLNMAVESVAPGLLTITADKPTTISQGESITLSATPGFSTYTWSSGQTDSAITVSPNQSTIYTLEATDANGCEQTETKDVTVLISSGIDDITDNVLQIAPNPSNGTFNIAIPTANQQVALSVFDVNGSVVYQRNIQNEETTLRLNWLTPGVYYLKAAGENLNQHHKIVIQ